VLGVDRQVRYGKRVVFAGVGIASLIECVQPFLNGVLVAAGERGVHEVAHIGVPRRDGQPIAVFGDTAQLVDVGDVEFGIHTVHKKVHGEVDHVYVACPLAVSEQRALNPIGAGHHAEFGGSDGTAAVVVRVQRDDDVCTVFDRAAEPLDHVAVHVWGVALDGRRQVEDDRVIGVRLDDIHHRFAHLDCVVGFGEGKTFGAVLVADLGG